jgi:hypothetical protein
MGRPSFVKTSDSLIRDGIVGTGSSTGTNFKLELDDPFLDGTMPSPKFVPNLFRGYALPIVHPKPPDFVLPFGPRHSVRDRFFGFALRLWKFEIKTIHCDARGIFLGFVFGSEP